MVALVLSSALLACSLPPKTNQQAEPAQTPTARIEAIPPADSAKYTNLRDMKGWRNPYLIVDKAGVSLLDMSNHERRPLKPEELLAALAGLPASAWPYGRVVAVQENGVGSSEADKVAIRRNRAILAGTLESAHVLINWVPST